MLQDNEVYLKMRFAGKSEKHIAYVLLSDTKEANTEYYYWLNCSQEDLERDLNAQFAHPDDADWDLERVYHPPVPSIYEAN